MKNIDLDSKISTDLLTNWELTMLGEKKIDENVNKINDLTYPLGKDFFTRAGFKVIWFFIHCLKY